MAEAQMYSALAQLAEQKRLQTEQTQALIQMMAARQGAERGGEQGRQWDSMERYRELKVFDGSQREYE